MTSLLEAWEKVLGSQGEGETETPEPAPARVAITG